MKKVLTYGTFDLFHIGHLNVLERAKSLGDYLIVGVSSDDFNAIKGKSSYHSEDDRVRIVSALRCVDEVLVENDWNQKISDIQANDISVFTIGDDWEGKFDFLSEYCDVVYLGRTENVSSTKIREDNPRK